MVCMLVTVASARKMLALYSIINVHFASSQGFEADFSIWQELRVLMLLVCLPRTSLSQPTRLS